MRVGFPALAFFCLLGCVIAQVRVLEDDYFERRWLEAYDRVQTHRREDKDHPVKIYVEHLLSNVADVQRKFKTGKLTLGSFSYKDCGTSKAIAHVTSLTVAPDPVILPGSVNVSVIASVRSKVASPIKAVMKVEAKIVGIWVEIPCVDNFGSCTYEDACTLLPKSEDDCPEALKKRGIHCTCPFAPGNFTLPASPFKLPSIQLPVHLSNTPLRLTAHVSQGGAEVGCLNLELTVTID